MRNSNRLLIVGTLPATAGIGGVTIHIKRLLEFLDVRNFKYGFCDYKVCSIWTLLKVIASYKIIHINITNAYLVFALTFWAMLLRKKVIITRHSNISRGNKISRILIRLSISIADAPIVLNTESLSIAKHYNKRSIQISSFIPPIKEETLTPDVKEQLSRFSKSGYERMFCTNAYAFALDSRGNEIYGLNCLLKIFAMLRDYGLIISDPSGTYTVWFRERGIVIPENVLIIAKPHSFFEIIRLTDAVIRNTSTDGDSVTVKEALYIGKPVLCSNSVSRPKGCTLYPYNNTDAIKEVLCSDLTPPHAQITNGAEQLIEIYNSF